MKNSSSGVCICVRVCSGGNFLSNVVQEAFANPSQLASTISFFILFYFIFFFGYKIRQIDVSTRA